MFFYGFVGVLRGFLGFFLWFCRGFKRISRVFSMLL